MDLDDTLRTLCPDAHGRVLGVLAHADEPLTASQVAHRAGLSPRGVVRALNDLVAGGLVWRAKVTPYWHWHVLYREHLAADLVLALARAGLHRPTPATQPRDVLAGRAVGTRPVNPDPPSPPDHHLPRSRRPSSLVGAQADRASERGLAVPWSHRAGPAPVDKVGCHRRHRKLGCRSGRPGRCRQRPQTRPHR